MVNNRIVFDFGSTFFTLYGEGRTLLRKPAAIIATRSMRPTVVAVGEEAIRLKNNVSEDDLFIRPVKKGAVAHKFGCTYLIRECVEEVFGKLKKPPMCVLVGCGLNPEQKNEIEHAFIDAGITDVFLMESLMGLIPEIDNFNIKIAAVIGGETTEIGLFDGGKLISGYSVDIGGNTVNARLVDFVKENYKLVISEESAEELKINAGSLYPNDLSKFAVVGADAITGRGKRLVLTAKEIHSEVLYVYGRILKVLDAVLLAAPTSTMNVVKKTGILFTGFGSLQEGLRDYTARMLKLPAIILPPEKYIVLRGASKLCNDPVFIDDYLKFGKRD